MVSNVSLVYVRAMIGAAGRANEENNVKKRKIGVCQIFSCGSSHSVSYGFCTRGPDKKHDDLVGIALLEALVEQFIYFSESDVHRRVIQRGRIEGPGRG